MHNVFPYIYIALYILVHVHIGSSSTCQGLHFFAGGELFGTAKLTHVKQAVCKAHPSRGGLGASPPEIKKNCPEIESGGVLAANQPFLSSTAC